MLARIALSLLFLLSAWPALASEELGRQEDSASADGQTLMPIGCGRQDTIAGSTSTDGDYGLIKCNNVGRLYTSTTIDAALPAGGNAIGSVTITSIVPGTGATNLGKAEGGTHSDADAGVALWAVRHDTSTTGLGVDGTYAALGLNASGELYTTANTEISTPAALADNTANPTLGGVAAYMMCFDGTNWDRCLPGLSDTDDNSIAFSQVTSLVLSENLISDGTSWVRRLTYLEDAASAGGEQLHLAGAVRQDTPAGSTSTDGDYTYLKTDSFSSLWVNCRSGCSGGTQYAEDSVAANADTGTMALAKRTDTPAGQTSADGDYGTLTLDSLNSLWVNCRTGCSGGTQKAEDSASADGDVGTLAMARRTASPANTSGTDLDYETLQMNGGRLWVSATVDAALPAGGNTIGTVNIGTTPGTVVEDAAETAGGTGVFVLSVRRDTPTTSSNSTGDNSTFNTSSIGALYTQNIAGPSGGATPCYITSAASTNSTSCKGSAGTLFTVSAVNTTGTLYYLRLYNSAAAPTCSSATGFIETIPVPASSTGAGVVRDVSVGEAFGTGIGFCLTGGGSSTDNTNAATGVYVTLLYN